jgi:hypothetical protein
MKLLPVLISISVLSVATILFFNFVGEVLLGFVLSTIMFCWPIGFWALSKVTEKWGKPKTIEKAVDQEIVEERHDEPAPPKKDLNKLGEDLQKLKKASETLDEEKKDGMLSDDAYNDLKKKNDEAISRIEKELYG